MFLSVRGPSRWWAHARIPLPLVLVLSLLIAASGATPAQAQSRRIARHHQAVARLRSAFARKTPHAKAATTSIAPFRRGDVFIETGAGIGEYSPTGQLVQTLPAILPYGSACFDPSGQHLIVPGVGLFDNSGNLLPSSWAAFTGSGPKCVADGFGHVYVSAPTSSSVAPDWTITKYSLQGNRIQTFNVLQQAQGPFAMDLAPDECTIYYGSFLPMDQDRGQLNGCTNTLSGAAWNADDLRVLPDRSVVTVEDEGAILWSGFGQAVRTYQYVNPTGGTGTVQQVALDPDGTSFWSCCWADTSTFPVTYDVVRSDINSGALLSAWPSAGGLFAVYSPPLLGDADVEAVGDSNPAGSAEAFTTTAGYSGQMTRLHVWVDSASTASQAVVGLYSDQNGHPGTLLSQATISNPTAGSWNYVDVPPVAVTAGQRVWIAVLGPAGKGTIRFRDVAKGGHSEASAKHNLTALPAKWASGGTYPSAPLSAYGS